jgi:glutathione synthase
VKVLVIVNRISELTSRQSTAMLIAELSRRAVELYVGDLEGIRITMKDEAAGIACSATASCIDRLHSSTDIAQLREASLKTFNLSAGDVVILRTNPGRDPDRKQQHQAALWTLAALDFAGVRVINRPTQLFRLAAKSSLFGLNARYRPAGIITDSLDQLVAFANGIDECIVKPIVGSRGEGVHKLVSPLNQDDVSTIAELQTRGSVICQEFVPWDQRGDVRLVVLDGKPLEIDGKVAAIHRVPATGDFRGNLHAGGTACAIEPTPAMLEAAKHAAQFLNSQGVMLAGIDLVNDQVIEMNVFSTGGLFDAERLYNREFVATIVTHMMQ